MLFRRIATSLGLAGALLAAAAPAPAASAPTTAPAVTERDAAFLMAAHQAHLAEIAAGRLAWLKTTDKAVKGLAGVLMGDHIRLDAALYGVARKLRVFLPGKPTAEQQALAARYEAAGADTFDEYFVSTQLVAHRASLAMVKKAAAESDAPIVRDLAEDAVPIIEKHRDHLRAVAAATDMVGYSEPGGRS
ncbi:hypothetical protein AMIS_51760 [Actinoplanes missouriensis 431]|uniref:DUF4142 domain-containing protein n=1 Tax=Actinoplanes missouriensis (strain ATCC 14538 / DSM 43046 / CBS 188.64 / JCM 3121 / NBRC 102363 / NCIMB 12654 / NRRL B-3342 / UNCC 431) TaxID=512565 RepID=I0HBK9_ACTM4|nr:DUF4142 domain-containing protein [Actinoplanes missouriensis]BAL90396.1 hypothetical protein AMIS_51760 [Actinoplanes missouriensis 431]